MKKLLIFTTVLLFTTNTFGQAPKDSSKYILQKVEADQALYDALKFKDLPNVIDNKTVMIKDSAQAVNIAEPILFNVYGKKEILNQRPYIALLVDHYWVVMGKQDRGSSTGKGQFVFIIDEMNGNIIRITKKK